MNNIKPTEIRKGDIISFVHCKQTPKLGINIAESKEILIVSQDGHVYYHQDMDMITLDNREEPIEWIKINKKELLASIESIRDGMNREIDILKRAIELEYEDDLFD